MLQMFQFTIWQKPFEECGFTSLLDGVMEVRKNLTLCAELLELLQYNFGRIDFIDERVEVGFDCPLDLHCDYTRDQILVALDFFKNLLRFVRASSICQIRKLTLRLSRSINRIRIILHRQCIRTILSGRNFSIGRARARLQKIRPPDRDTFITAKRAPCFYYLCERIKQTASAVALEYILFWVKQTTCNTKVLAR